MDRYIGKKLEGRYEILELIGFGGMAIVFKAFDLLENRHVAVKILKDEFLQNEDFKRRFRNESKAIALLSHPSIVKVFDVNFSDNIQYIVMEYIDGITLKEYIEQQGAIKWKEAVHFTVQILRALQHAHDNGIVHRDVKPQNVMLLEDGSIKVMDFGIARFARENGKTLSDKAIGSVHYISPEQARGENTDEKTDIYAVGVMLYEMLTGKVPFDGDTPVSIAIKQMQSEPPMPTSIKADIPIGLEEIILRAMQKDPQLRYQTAAEMLRDIDEFKHNPSVVFEYRYLNQDGTTKYFDKIDVHGKGVTALAQEEPKKRSYVMNILAGVTAACVLLAIVALYFFFKGLNNKPDELVLPNFVGLTVTAAQKAAPTVKIVSVEEQPSPDYDKGVIIEQKPLEGTKVKVKSTVDVIVSAGLESLVMPDLVNETTSGAKSKLNAMGIVDIEVVQKSDSSIAVGHVIYTEPSADAEVKKGDKVVVCVSAGTPDLPIPVPTLIGKTQVEATAALLRVGLKMGTVTIEDSNEKKDLVFWQSVDPEKKVKKGDTIDIKISSGVAAAQTVVINIVFPTGMMDKDHEFAIYVNNAALELKTVNPSKTPSMKIEVSLGADGKINGKIDTQEYNEMTIGLPEGTFAQYTLDFTTGVSSAIQPPNYDMLSVVGGDTPLE